MRKWLVVAALVIVIDQITKLLVQSHFQFGELYAIIPGCFSLTLTYNPGAAFSFLADAGGWQRYFFTALALGVSAFIVFTLRKHHQQTRFSFALALIMGGALGNVIDRLAYHHVIDFILVYWKNWYYPAFNVADSAICIGAALLVIDSIARPQHTREKTL
ncbi:signal peptidase II [Silvimonas iriomotensis]|uniref:Lipoprotein signal peptidase n=1 Tax=Silvimonas iriomotensis TaxID=449662 RepID=A0ABQ2P6E1_9NEIS|nr:signal peptidase II [Silvimonas iriomotensis]GGP19114.1 lipoprotein signal peptidase [Silvimonas iriomotensis]